MDEDQPYVIVGKFALTKGIEAGRIGIYHDSGDRAGEGGDFSEAALEALIQKFYTERF